MQLPKNIILRNNNGMELNLLDLGATIHSLKVPDARGEQVNVIVGLKSASDYGSEVYIKQNAYLGASVGRFAGRINNPVVLDGLEYKLSKKNGIHLHGGRSGFDRKIWEVVAIEGKGPDPAARFRYISEHLEEGYPGRLTVEATFRLTGHNELMVTYEATTDRHTIVNLTNHAYFNLNGNGSLTDHFLQLNSNERLMLDSNKLPTGERLALEGSNFDFSNPRRLHPLDFGGLDDVFILNKTVPHIMLYSELTQIKMEVSTNQAAVVVYIPDSLNDLPVNEPYKNVHYPGICLETQNFPDAPNHPGFPSALLAPGETYISRSIYSFGLVS